MSLLSNRTVSALPLSIGTSLAFESVFAPRQAPYDPNRILPPKIEIKEYQELWINIATLFRNIVGAVQKEFVGLVQSADVVDTLYSEIDMIDNILKEESNGQCLPIFYYNTYDDLLKSHTLHKSVKFRTPNTPNQIAYHDQLVKTATTAINENYVHITVSKGHLVPLNPNHKVLILTHVPWDLLSYTHTKKLDLIESHTGVLKSRQQWNTKYYQMNDDAIRTLPFTRKLLLIFGDNILIHPQDIGFRRLILEIAKKRNFTPLTTEEKIRFYLDSDIRERYLMEVYDRL